MHQQQTELKHNPISLTALSNKLTLSLLFGTTTLFISGCQTTPVSHYAQAEPALLPQKFFNGKLCAHGVVKDIKGNVNRLLNAEIQAHWDDTGVGTLDEIFMFSDVATNKKSRETRVWTLRPSTVKNQYIASASDVVGDTALNYSGNAINMAYTLRYVLPEKGEDASKQLAEPKTIDLQMNDWMYLVNPTTVINTTQMKKFGINVGEVVLTIRKVDDSATCL